MSFFLRNLIIISNKDGILCNYKIIKMSIINSKKYFILKFRLIYDWNNEFSAFFNHQIIFCCGYFVLKLIND